MNFLSLSEIYYIFHSVYEFPISHSHWASSSSWVGLLLPWLQNSPSSRLIHPLTRSSKMNPLVFFSWTLFPIVKMSMYGSFLLAKVLRSSLFTSVTPWLLLRFFIPMEMLPMLVRCTSFSLSLASICGLIFLGMFVFLCFLLQFVRSGVNSRYPFPDNGSGVGEFFGIGVFGELGVN